MKPKLSSYFTLCLEFSIWEGDWKDMRSLNFCDPLISKEQGTFKVKCAYSINTKWKFFIFTKEDKDIIECLCKLSKKRYGQRLLSLTRK